MATLAIKEDPNSTTVTADERTFDSDISSTTHSQALHTQVPSSGVTTAIIISTSVGLAAILVVLSIISFMKRDKSAIKRPRPQPSSNEPLTTRLNTSKFWISHAVNDSIERTPVDQVDDLQNALTREGYQCLSSLSCDMEIHQTGFQAIHNLMNSVSKIVVCCDKRYIQHWRHNSRCKMGGTDSKNQPEDAALLHEHINIKTQVSKSAYKRLVVVLLGDANWNCIPACLQGLPVPYCRFPDVDHGHGTPHTNIHTKHGILHNFPDLIKQLKDEDTEPSQPSCSHDSTHTTTNNDHKTSRDNLLSEAKSIPV